MPAAPRGGPLRPVELDQRPLVVENRAQLGILRVGQIALRLQDEEVRRQADLELALLRLELSFGQLPRRRCGLDALPDRLDAKRRVGDLAGYPQLDAANLGPVLLQLQPGAFVRGPVRAPTERVAHLQLHVPDRIVGVGDAVESIPVAPRDHAAAAAEDVLEAVPSRNQPRTALTGELVAPDQIERGQGAVAEIVDGRFIDVELAARTRDVRAPIERPANRRLQVDRPRFYPRFVRGIDLRVPKFIRGASHDELLQGQLARPLRLDGHRQQLASRRSLGLRRHDVDRRHRSDLDAHPVVLHELLGQRHRLPLHAHGGARIDEIPVGQAYVGERVDDGLLEVDVGDVPVDARDDQLRAPRIGPKAAQQRLRVLQRHVRAEARVEGREDVGRLRPGAVPGDVVPAAAPLDLLTDPEVVGAPVGDDGLAAKPAAVEHEAVGCGLLVEVEARRGDRQERRAGRGDTHVLHQRVDALDGDVEVALESALHDIVEREVEAAGRLPGPARLPCDGGDPLADNGTEALSVRCARSRGKHQTRDEWPEYEGTNLTRQDHPPVWKSNPAYSTEEQRGPRGMHRRLHAAGLSPPAASHGPSSRDADCISHRRGESPARHAPRSADRGSPCRRSSPRRAAPAAAP